MSIYTMLAKHVIMSLLPSDFLTDILKRQFNNENTPEAKNIHLGSVSSPLCVCVKLGKGM